MHRLHTNAANAEISSAGDHIDWRDWETAGAIYNEARDLLHCTSMSSIKEQEVKVI